MTHATDSTSLRQGAYRNAGPLASRQSIYACSTADDFVDAALGMLDWSAMARVVDVGCGNG